VAGGPTPRARSSCRSPRGRAAAQGEVPRGAPLDGPRATPAAWQRRWMSPAAAREDRRRPGGRLSPWPRGARPALPAPSRPRTSDELGAGRHTRPWCWSMGPGTNLVTGTRAPTALIQASASGHAEVLTLLIARGADVNLRVWSDRSGPQAAGTALFAAAEIEDDADGTPGAPTPRCRSQSTDRTLRGHLRPAQAVPHLAEHAELPRRHELHTPGSLA
jgi:hypothetical protein